MRAHSTSPLIPPGTSPLAAGPFTPKPRHPARRGAPLLALVGALLIGAPAIAADKSSGKAKEAPKDNRVWALVRVDDTTVLRFGVPGAADPIFAASCQPGAGLLQFTVELKSGKIRSGDGIALTLGVGKRRLELAASTFRGAVDDTLVAEAAVALDDRLLDLLAAGDTLSVHAPGVSTSFPLGGAKAKLADFKRACQPRR